MAFQSTVRIDYGFGVPGEIVYSGPHRARPGILASTSAANNVVGRAFTEPATGGGNFSADASGGVFAGILANPKVYSSLGTSAAGTLAPTLILPNGVIGEFLTMGLILLQEDSTQVAAPAIGDVLIYNIATGVITTQAASASVATGFALVPNATVDRLPGTLGVGNLFVANLKN